MGKKIDRNYKKQKLKRNCYTCAMGLKCPKYGMKFVSYNKEVDCPDWKSVSIAKNC